MAFLIWCGTDSELLIDTFYVLTTFESPWYDLHGWLGVTSQYLSIYLLKKELTLHRPQHYTCKHRTDTTLPSTINVYTEPTTTQLHSLVMPVSRTQNDIDCSTTIPVSTTDIKQTCMHPQNLKQNWHDC